MDVDLRGTVSSRLDYYALSFTNYEVIPEIPGIFLFHDGLVIPVLQENVVLFPVRYDDYVHISGRIYFY